MEAATVRERVVENPAATTEGLEATTEGRVTEALEGAMAAVAMAGHVECRA